MKYLLLRLLSNLIPNRAARRRFRMMHCGRIKRNYDRFHRRCRAGEGSYAAPDVNIPDRRTEIGRYCSIGAGVSIGTTRHPLDWLSTHPMQYLDLPFGVRPSRAGKFNTSAPCRIGSDVWIGRNAVIMDGVEVGDGAVIAAGAVVTKNVPSYAIVGGVPAKVIRNRFDEKTVIELSELKWFELDPGLIAQLPFDDVPRCIEKLREIRRRGNYGG